MKRFWDRVSVVGSLMLSLPVLAGAAGVARAQSINTDLSTPAAVASFTRQVDETATRMCRAESTVGTRIAHIDACKKAVWEEVNERLTGAQRAQLKSGRAALAAAPEGAAPATSTVR